MVLLAAAAGADAPVVQVLPTLNHNLTGVYPGDGPQTAFSSPAIGDIAGDVEPELVIGNFDGTIYAFSLTGTQSAIWKADLGRTAVQSTPTLADLNGDGKADVVVGTMDGRVVWIDGPTGRVVRTFRQGAPQHCPPGTDCRPDGFFATPAVVDLNGDGRLDIVAPSYDHSVYAWSSSGSLLWRRYLEDTLWSSPVVVDIDGDRRPEIILGGDIWAGNPLGVPEGGLVWILRRDGSTYPGYPRSTPGQTVWSSPAVADLDGNGLLDVVVGTGRNWADPRGRRVDAFTARTGKNLLGWPVTVEGRVMASPAIGDLNGDGRLDVSFASDGGWIYAYSGGGRRLWRACNAPNPSGCKTGFNTEGGTSIADVDADGQQEVVSMLSRDFRILDGLTGGEEYRFPITSTPPPTGTAPSITEVEGRTVIAQATIFRQVGHSGPPLRGDGTKVFLYSTGVPLCRADWPQFHRDAGHTGIYRPDHLRWAPFDCPSEFVARQYSDFMGRSADPGGVTYWSRRLRTGTSGATVIRSFLASLEFGAKVAPILRSYIGIFGTYPGSSSDVTDAVAQGRAGATQTQIADGFAARPEIAALDDPRFVEQLWRNVYGRGPTSAERSAALQSLQSGASRGALVIKQAHGSVGAERLDAQVNVAMVYLAMLGRAPDPGGWKYWVVKVETTNLDQLVTGFQRSAEYQRRVNGS